MFNKITSNCLRDELVKQESPKLIDLRSQQEFYDGHIEGSVNIPWDGWNVEQIIENHRNETVCLICHGGRISQSVAELLRDSGFVNAVVLAGGILAWRVMGFPLNKIS